jgi:filamentous hemagglutinin family protein
MENGMMRLRNLLLITTALMPFFGVPAFAGPEGAVVVGGQVNVQNPGTANVTVNQFSDKAIVNWHTFNIGANERTQFVQPNSSSVILNRVTGGLGPSEILGRLDGNGRVFVVNRDGFIFGAGAVISTAGFLATTSDIKNDDFMAGRYNFSIPGRSDASIVNMGTITATNGGFAGLVAPGVRNSGTITANLGTVVLGAGNIFTLDFYGDKLITLSVNDQIAGNVKDVATGQTLKSLITNDGKLKANGGRVELTAAAARQVVDSVINTSGVIEASSVGMKNGQIVLGAATAWTKGDGLPTQTVKISGKLSAAGKKAGTKGGTILVTGEDIQVTGANIDASGRDGGGKVMIGGDWGGGNPNTALVSNQSAKLEGYAIYNATTVSVDGATKIDASAKDRGDGGKVVLWSDQTTSFAGTILALAGREIGNGGFVETSGHGKLNFTGNVDTGAPSGKAGTLLLDPADFYIVTTLGGSPTGAARVAERRHCNEQCCKSIRSERRHFRQRADRLEHGLLANLGGLPQHPSELRRRERHGDSKYQFRQSRASRRQHRTRKWRDGGTPRLHVLNAN